MNPFQKLARIKQNWDSHTRDAAARYAAMMTQVEALRVEVSVLEAEIRRTELSDLSPAHKSARIRGLASRAAESYGQMLSLLRQAADVYPAVLTRPLDIPHSFSSRERQRLIHLPERPPGLGRREATGVIAAGVGFFLGAMLLTKLLVLLITFPAAP